MVWYGMVWYGMGFTFHGMVVLVWSSYTTVGMGTLGALNQGIDVPHRSPKMGD